MELRNCHGREGIGVWLVDYGTSNKNERKVMLFAITEKVKHCQIV